MIERRPELPPCGRLRGAPICPTPAAARRPAAASPGSSRSSTSATADLELEAGRTQQLGATWRSDASTEAHDPDDSPPSAPSLQRAMVRSAIMLALKDAMPRAVADLLRAAPLSPGKVALRVAHGGRPGGAARSPPSGSKHGVLVVEAASPQWADEVRRSSPVILAPPPDAARRTVVGAPGGRGSGDPARRGHRQRRPHADRQVPRRAEGLHRAAAGRARRRRSGAPRRHRSGHRRRMHHGQRRRRRPRTEPGAPGGAATAGCPTASAALTINKVCGSGLKAVMLAAQGIAAGDIDIAVAGGMESMSNCPYLLPRVRTGLRMGHGELVDAMITTGCGARSRSATWATAGEVVAEHYGVGREAQDDYAARSHPKAAAATDDGWFGDEILPVTMPAAEGRAGHRRSRRVDPRRHHRRRARRAEAGVQEGRHGHRRQCARRQRRRLGAGGDVGGAGARARPHAARPRSSVRRRAAWRPSSC